MQADLSKAYALRFDRTAAYRDAIWKVLSKRFFQALVPQDGAVLDLGCGWGEFINNITAATKYGMDLNPDAPAKLAKGVRFLGQNCAHTWQLEDASLDVVFTSNFFEHLPDKTALRATLAEAYRTLKPGGTLICLGPNIRVLGGAYWDFWDHYLPLTDASLKEGLGLAGFDVTRVVPRFLPYSMSQGYMPPVALVRAYLKMPWLWPLFGKQFLLVARKPQ